MEKISIDVILVNILEFLNVCDAANTRRTCRHFRNCMDYKPYWDSFLYKTKKPSICVLKHASAGLGCIITRQSVSRHMCVSCGEYSDSNKDNIRSYIQTHPFFGIMSCKTCMINNPVLSIISENEACKKYKISMDEISSLPRVKKRTFHVLDINARFCGELKHGVDFIQNMLDKSNKRKVAIRENRINKKSRRLSELETYVRMMITADRKIDIVLSEMSIWLDIIVYHDIGRFILGDLFENRSTVGRVVEHAGKEVVDFCRLLTHCRRNNVLCSDYKSCSPGHADFLPGIVFKNSISGGDNYYEFMGRYIKSIDDLMDRSRSVEFYTKKDGSSLTLDDRIIIVDILCMEDYVEINYNPFEEYIEHGVGDPVFMARELRKLDVFFQAGLYEEMNYLHHIGVDDKDVYGMARRSILRRMGGLPIMKRFFIDDRIPSI